MNKTLTAALLAAAFLPAARAETVGDAVSEAGHEVKKVARKAHDVVWTRCADGRQTVKGKGGCEGHGGVAHPAPKTKPEPEPPSK